MFGIIVNDKLVLELLKENSLDIFKNQLQYFVRARSKRSICRGKVNYFK